MNGESTTLPKPHWMQPLVMGRNPKWTLIRVAVLIVTSFVVFRFILLPIRVVGISMEPSYRNGRWNFVNKLAYRRAKPQRGDVVAVRWAGEHVMLLKRIVGLPGESVTIRQKGIYINGRLLTEPYVLKRVHQSWYRAPYRDRSWQLEDDDYLVIGDNRSMPLENHTKGALRRDQIVGKVLF